MDRKLRDLVAASDKLLAIVIAVVLIALAAVWFFGL